MQHTVFLVDMNAFFISCETTRNNALSGKPAAVAGDPQRRAGIILAANYEARAFGVKTAMVLHEALKLCPHLILVAPDHTFYENKSSEVMSLLGEFTPVIEQNSIDEAWLDMTGTEGLFGPPLNSAKKIMTRIQNELGLWCSIGISENKFLAKMASEMKKPLGITELWKKDMPNKLWPLPVGSMYGIGKQTAPKLTRLGIQSIGDLAKFNRDILVKQFGKTGAILHQLANGNDPAPVQPHGQHEMKSIGRSMTLSEDITEPEAAKKILMQLAEDIGMTARKANKKGRVVQITVKYADFQQITRQQTISPTYLTKEICAAGIQLLLKHWHPYKAVRLLGISISGFDDDCDLDQISMFQLPELGAPAVKEEKLEKAMDKIREKHGNAKINRAALMDDPKSDP